MVIVEIRAESRLVHEIGELGVGIVRLGFEFEKDWE